jgi:hypothetical protein
MGYLVLVAFAGCALLSGCATERLDARDRVPPIVGTSTATASTTADGKGGAGGFGIGPGERADAIRARYAYPVNLETFTFPDRSAPAYVEALTDASLRNRLQDHLARISDDVCSKHQGDILAVASTWNGGLSVFTTVLGGLGAIFTGATTTRALAGSAGIASGIRSNINENVFYNNFGTAIVRQIDAQRKQKLLEIAPKRSLSINDYSADAALRDIAEYHNLCSFYEAVAALATDTKRPPTADELKGRMADLRAEQTRNTARITELNNESATRNGGEVRQLTAENETLSRMLGALTVQLGLVQGVPSAAPSTPASASPGSAGNQ